MTQQEFLKITNFREALKVLKGHPGLDKSKQVREHINELV